MRTVLARLIALGALSAVVGCSGNSTVPLPVSGGSNGSGGSSGTVTGSVTGGTGTSTGPVTCNPFNTVCTGPEAYTFNLTGYPATLVIAAGTTATLTLQAAAITGGPVVPATSFSILYGSLKLTPAPTGTGSPTFSITSPNLPLPGRTSYTAAFVNATGATVTTAGTANGNSVVFPSISTYTWPASGTALFAVYAS